MSSTHDLDVATQELLHAIVEQAPDAMIYADRTGLIRLWNHAAETLFGYTSAEVLGHSLDIIIPGRFQRAHWAGYQKALETGDTRYAGRVLTTRSIHKNGDKLYVDLAFAMIKNRTGMIVGALATGRNVTGIHLARKTAPGTAAA